MTLQSFYITSVTLLISGIWCVRNRTVNYIEGELIDVNDSDSRIYYDGDEKTYNEAFSNDQFQSTYYYRPYWEYYVGDDLISDLSRMCYLIATTYKSAFDDVREHFTLRYLYTTSIEYEMGYVIQDIVTRYQKMIEIYHMIELRYNYTNPRAYHAAPAFYLLYMYSSILDQSKTIIHLCNMIAELPRKYQYAPMTIFKDYEDITEENITYTSSQEKENYYKKVEGAYMQKVKDEKELKKSKLKERNKNIFKTLPTARTLRPKKKSSSDAADKPYDPFPIVYGWSIEDW